MKFSIFASEKNLCILHGQVFIILASNLPKAAVCFLEQITLHYENMSMQYTEIFNVVKNENFQ